MATFSLISALRSISSGRRATWWERGVGEVSACTCFAVDSFRRLTRVSPVNQLYSMPVERPFLNTDVVTELVSYIVKPEAHILTGILEVIPPRIVTLTMNHRIGECINFNGMISIEHAVDNSISGQVYISHWLFLVLCFYALTQSNMSRRETLESSRDDRVGRLTTIDYSMEDPLANRYASHAF